MKIRPLSFADVSALNKAAGDPLRLEVLRVLAENAYGVLELCEIFDYRQSGMSHHLKVLAEADLVMKRREGNSIFYSRALPYALSGVAALQQQLYETVDQIAMPDKIVHCIQRVHEGRTSASKQFFVQQAERFKAQQDLIAEYPVYGNAVEQLLDQTMTDKRALAIEVGPGAGEFLPALASRFQQIIALDNAPTMLEKSQRYCVEKGIANVDFVSEDTHYLQQNPIVADCVVMNMVLHHTPSPADIFLHIANSLRQGGILIVTDLCRHDQDWAKTACGDIWLGFDSEELKRWALLAGLEQGHSNYLALRNGFQIQLQQFIKNR
jgi:DNA-binding transcriptional ArsR family regulator/predicted O-methyltransferase YrrM